MGFGKELREPWGLLLAASTAGVAWAVQLSPLAAVGAGIVVLGTRAGVAALGNKGVPVRAKLIDVDPRLPEGVWAARTTAAAAGFESVSASLEGGPLAERVADMEAGVQETVVTLRRLAERATMTGRALDRVDLAALAAEKARLRRALKSADEDVRGDLDQALASIQAQEDVHARLTSARTKLLARLQSGALGLETLVTRVVELSALADSDAPDTSTVADLGDQLEGIRRGVVETDEATRRALGS